VVGTALAGRMTLGMGLGFLEALEAVFTGSGLTLLGEGRYGAGRGQRTLNPHYDINIKTLNMMASPCFIIFDLPL
jgi:hypothetical protein